MGLKKREKRRKREKNGGRKLRTWQSGDSGAHVKEVIDSNFNELETYIHSISNKKDKGWFKMFGRNKKVADAELRLGKRIEGVRSTINDRAETLLREIDASYRQIKDMAGDYKYLKDIVKSQQKTIEILTNALCDKYNHGLFVYSEDGKMPMVIRNGKKITDDLTTEFSISWCPGELPNIQIEQRASTTYDEEE